jgi:hypothetical protein
VSGRLARYLCFVKAPTMLSRADSFSLPLRSFSLLSLLLPPLPPLAQSLPLPSGPPLHNGTTRTKPPSTTSPFTQTKASSSPATRVERSRSGTWAPIAVVMIWWVAASVYCCLLLLLCSRSLLAEQRPRKGGSCGGWQRQAAELHFPLT